jgi:hypothetical protein
MADSPTPLCSPAQFTAGALKDLVKGYTEQALYDLLAEGTRRCEDITQRRLAPFSNVTEYIRAEGIDPDEYTDAANLPMDVRSTLSASYAQALGASSLVRHCWVSEFAPRYQEMWSYSNVSVTIIRSYGGTQQVSPAQILSGPEPDTGHLWFMLGMFLPVGSRIQVTMSGGYTIATPASLVRANKFMAAYLAVRELNPDANDHDPDQLHNDALMWLEPWMRE